jgi:hypothetical protein
MASLFASFGYEATWRLWNIPTLTLPFGDLRVITGGAESRRQGFDPMIENPGDPWGRPLNYPRIWQSFYRVGLTPEHTTFIGFAFIALFLTGICLILPNASWTIIALVIAALLSPATLLGMERGNIDLLMFFIVSVAVFAANRWPAFSAIAVFGGFALKLYPLFAGAVLLRTSRSLFFRLIVVLVGAVSLYVILTYSDFALIRAATQNGIVFSYGMNVFPASLRTGNSQAKLLSYLVVLLSLFFGLTALRRRDNQVEEQKGPIYLDAFRAGAAIYIGTFLLGSNWDYRLIFLILTIPQLAVWVKAPARHASVISILVMSAMLLSMWYLKIAWYIGGLTFADQPVCFLLDQIYKWVAVAGLVYLFFWSLPAWVKEFVLAVGSKLRNRTLRPFRRGEIGQGGKNH